MKLGFRSLTAVLACLGTVNANQVREYNMTLSSAFMAKDGHPRPYLTINGDTPGPVIEADEGDTVRVNVENKLLTETSIHWHGIYQVDHFWNDGTPGVTQWPIQARGSYSYEFTLTNQSGAYFYHGHFGPVFADGHRGAIWIRPSKQRPRPYSHITPDKGEIAAMQRAESRPYHLMTSDWYLETLDAMILSFRDSGYSNAAERDDMGCLQKTTNSSYLNSEPCRDTFTDYEVIEALEGDKYLFVNFIHTGVHHELRVSVDEHDMWVVAVDGDFVFPRKVTAFDLNMGERISVLIPLNQTPREYAIRMSSVSNEQLIQGFSILRYAGVKETRINSVMALPKTKASIDLIGNMKGGGKLLDPLKDITPFPARPPTPESDYTLRFVANRTDASTWVLASEPHQGFRQQMPPSLWAVDSRGPTTTSGLRNGSTVDIILENGAFGMHPFHKHNHKAWIIGSGTGGFPWPDVETARLAVPDNFNLINPPLRDGFRLSPEPGSWIVLRYTITFPATSMLHCHRIPHFAAGQQIVLLEGQEALGKIPEHVKNMTHPDFVPPMRYGPLD
ncbi:multicopper oxidase [Fusarium denticulatum]|uniref:Multicopper oxidase n=1 Tax=Fusarium denticulatum TaxID=48507 RepID=A0A8H5XJW6_9HYPO|nr:multicopper oxidase [Fusarium denticulatum]